MTKHDLAALAARATVPVTRVETGARAYDEKAIYKAMRNDTVAKSEDALIRERHVKAYDHMGRAVITNGIGELIAVE